MGGWYGLGLVQELVDGVAEAIIHDTIEGLVEPGPGIAKCIGLEILPPDFAGDEGIGVDGFDPLTELDPEAHGDFGGDVEAPAIDTVLGVAVIVGVHPALDDGMEVLADIGVERGFCAVEFGEVLDADPALVVEFVLGCIGVVPLFDDEPICEAAGGALLPGFLESPEGDADVIEDAVDDDTHIALVDFADELEEEFVGGGPFPGGRVGGVFAIEELDVAFGVGAEVSVDVMVAGGAVFVERGGIEDRVEVEGIDAEVFEVIELIDDALDIASVAA
ncbi:MAG: hypothetical protein RI897_2598 [Verrucomicrobiota bacterium]